MAEFLMLQPRLQKHVFLFATRAPKEAGYTKEARRNIYMYIYLCRYPTAIGLVFGVSPTRGPFGLMLSRGSLSRITQILAWLLAFVPQLGRERGDSEEIVDRGLVAPSHSVPQLFSL